MAYKIIKGILGPEEDYHLLHFDGASKGNPGNSSAAAVIYSPHELLKVRHILLERGEFLGLGTNNQAEWQGLLIGLKSCIDLGIKSVLIEGDSLLVINQLLKLYKVNNPTLKVYYNEAIELLKDFNMVAIRHVLREYNRDADRIGNEVFIRYKSFIRHL
jgi:ribonuclease HI